VKHSIEQILQTIYNFYPRGMPQDDPRWPDTAESRRLVDARLRAGAERDRWAVLLARLRQQFDGCEVYDGSLHLISGNSGACYSAELAIVGGTSDVERHVLGFMSSFLMPYYVIYSYRRFRLDPATSDGKPPATRLDADESELVFWRGIVTEIENAYGNEPMPAEVGHVRVQDVMPGNRAMGDAMIYDCIFSDCPRLISQDDEFDLLLQKAWTEKHGKRPMWGPDRNGPETNAKPR
jgi:hypothetical protein